MPVTASPGRLNIEYEKIESQAPGQNPFDHDPVRMGTRIGTNVMVMHMNHPDEHAQYLIIVDITSGERLKVKFADIIGEVDYRLLKRDGNWEAYDIVIEGVSLVNNYRTQFNKIIRQDSYETLVKKLKLKIEQEDATSGG